VQWGAPIGKHEAIAAKLAWIASHTLRHGSDRLAEPRGWPTAARRSALEAAMAKLFNTEVAWQISDHLVQIRADADTKTQALAAGARRKDYPVERIMRDMRHQPHLRGTSEIQHLFIAREAVDPHMKRGFKILQPETPMGEKLSAVAKAGVHYAAWYPSRYIGWSRFPKFGEFGKLSETWATSSGVTPSLPAPSSTP